MKKWTKTLCFVLTLALGLGTLSACTKKSKLDNETYPLIFSTLEVEGVFSPFFATAGTDTNVVSNTQISMLSSDKNGEIAYGDDEPVVTKDLNVTMYDRNGSETKTGDKEGKTVYQFVLKKGIQFSDGVELTIEDVLFNLYVYLDPVYTGSSTIYSTAIQGLERYRRQDPNATENGDPDDETDNFEQTFQNAAYVRIRNVIDYLDETNIFTGDDLKKVESDLEKGKVLFREELHSDWRSASESVKDYEKDYGYTQPWQVFMLNAGITNVETDPYTGLPKKDGNDKFITDYQGVDAMADITGNDEESNVELVYANYTDKTAIAGQNMQAVLSGWATSTNLLVKLTAEEKTEYYNQRKEDGKMVVESISGIQALKGGDFNGTPSQKEQYADYDMLQISIYGVDPKAIWNFGIAVAPMHYYAGEQAKKFNLDSDVGPVNFGVDMGNVDFFDGVIKARNKVPMGAGAYQATVLNDDADGNFEKLKAGFYKNGMIYFKRNDNFIMGAPKIKYIRYKEVSATNVLNAIGAQTVHYADPQATSENISYLNERSYLSKTMVRTNGYGYIGINAKYVKDINIRKAIMTAMDTGLVKAYYPGELAELIARPMSRVSWVYDEGMGVPVWNPDPVYKYLGNDPDDSTKASKEELDEIEAYVRAAGYDKKGEGQKWEKTGATSDKTLKYTFVVAGDSDNHPVYSTMEKAVGILNDSGWDVTLKTDSRALTKLTSGGLQVWAAAWSSTIDPDMYQVYHKDSKATSVLSWGYDYIFNNEDDFTEEVDIINKLSKLIDQGRETIDQDIRKPIYREALDLVMDLAVELPVYQRNDMYVYNNNVLDVGTLIPENECTPFYGPLSKIWEISLNV